jgi:hypothetical protein
VAARPSWSGTRDEGVGAWGGLSPCRRSCASAKAFPANEAARAKAQPGFRAAEYRASPPGNFHNCRTSPPTFRLLQELSVSLMRLKKQRPLGLPDRTVRGRFGGGSAPLGRLPTTRRHRGAAASGCRECRRSPASASRCFGTYLHYGTPPAVPPRDVKETHRQEGPHTLFVPSLPVSNLSWSAHICPEG